MSFDVQKVFANRIGGAEFGKVQQTFKFTVIDNAKKQFIANNPNLSVIDMGVGEPEEFAPKAVVDQLATSALRHELRIYPNNGGEPFKRAASEYLKTSFKIDCDPALEILHCVGTKTALAQIPLAFVNPQDTVLATVPGYPTLPKVSQWLGANVVGLKLLEKNNFLPDLGELLDLVKQHKPKILLLNYPNNPTGAAAPLGFFEKIVALAHQYNFIIVQDAAYADFCHNLSFNSPLQVVGGKEVSLETYSLSKSFNMQGYRLGFVAGGAALIKAFGLVKDNTDNGQFLAIQQAGVEALLNQREFVRENSEKYGRRLIRVAEILSAVGITAKASDGTFFLYAQVPLEFAGQRFETAQAFSEFLLSKAGIVTVPWNEAGAFLRFSMTFEVNGSETEHLVLEAFKERLFSLIKS